MPPAELFVVDRQALDLFGADPDSAGRPMPSAAFTWGQSLGRVQKYTESPQPYFVSQGVSREARPPSLKKSRSASVGAMAAARE